MYFIEGCRTGKSGWTPDATGKIVLSEINHCKYYFRESHAMILIYDKKDTRRYSTSLSKSQKCYKVRMFEFI